MNLETNYCNINGHTIGYCERYPEIENTLLFIHGNSLSKEIFINQLTSEQFTNYRLVALDLPGHGGSEWIDSYSVNQIVEDLVAFCEQLRLLNLILVGHSLGGHMAIQALTRLKNIKGLVLIGTPPLQLPLNIEEAFNPHPAIPLLFKKELNQEETNLFTEAITTIEHQVFVKELISNTDPNFRESLLLSIQEGQMEDEVEILNSAEIPVELIFGEEDVLVNRSYLEDVNLINLYTEQPIFIPESLHSPHMENVKVFNSFLLKYSNN